jgi:hypothetical protein
MIGITVCKDCADREVGCHSSCTKYLAERMALEDLRQAAAEEKKKYDQFNEHRSAMIKTSLKKRGRKWT